MNLSKGLLFSLISLIFLGFVLIGKVYATSASTPHGYGIISSGMGGTGVAYPTDAITPATNPAGIVFLGRRGDLGVAFFGPHRGYSATTGVGPFQVAPGTYFSGATLFVIPEGGYVSPFSGGQGAWGISMYANGGLNTSYGDGINGSTIGNRDGVFGGGKTKADLIQLFNNFSVAWEFSPYFSLGASLILAHQIFEAKGFSPFAPFSVDPNHLSNNGLNYSFGGGGSVGMLSHLTHFLAIGASYEPEIPMTDLQEYAGLLPGNGAFNIPPRGTIGIALTPGNHLDLNFDVQHIWYSAVPAFSNPFICTRVTPCLGFTGGSGLGWDDTTVYKVGMQLFISPVWTLRFGYAHSSEPIKPTEILFNIIAPAVVKDHFTAGFTRYVGKHMAFNMAAMYAPTVSVTGPNPFNPTQMIRLTMHQYYVGFSWSWV